MHHGAHSQLPDWDTSALLIQRFQGGDSEALNELIRQYHPRLVRIVRVRLRPLVRHFFDEEDLVQDTYLVALKKLPAFELRSHSSTLQWLAGIAENIIRDKLEALLADKRGGGRIPAAIDSVPHAGDSTRTRGIASDDTSPSEAARHAEYERLLDAHVTELEPPDFREVIIERDYYCSDWERVRERMERPSIEAAQMLYHRAKTKLARQLKPHLRGLDSSDGLP